VITVVHIEDPIGTGWFAKPLAFDNELLAASLWVRLVSIQIDPLKIRTLLLALGSRLIVGVGLIIALQDGGEFFIRIQFATRSEQTEIQAPVKIDLRFGQLISLPQ
jgi:hypothetical protein